MFVTPLLNVCCHFNTIETDSGISYQKRHFPKIVIMAYIYKNASGQNYIDASSNSVPSRGRRTSPGPGALAVFVSRARFGDGLRTAPQSEEVTGAAKHRSTWPARRRIDLWRQSDWTTPRRGGRVYKQSDGFSPASRRDSGPRRELRGRHGT